MKLSELIAELKLYQATFGGSCILTAYGLLANRLEAEGLEELAEAHERARAAERRATRLVVSQARVTDGMEHCIRRLCETLARLRIPADPAVETKRRLLREALDACRGELSRLDSERREAYEALLASGPFGAGRNNREWNKKRKPFDERRAPLVAEYRLIESRLWALNRAHPKYAPPVSPPAPDRGPDL